MALDIPALLPAYSHNITLATPLFARCVRVHEHVCVCVCEWGCIACACVSGRASIYMHFNEDAFSFFLFLYNARRDGTETRKPVSLAQASSVKLTT